jgi:hypothetical protein
MFAKRHLRSGFRVIAATAVVAGAVMNLATHDRASAEHVPPIQAQRMYQ